MFGSTYHRQYRRRLPHFQNGGSWYHLVLSVVEGRRLSIEAKSIVAEALRFYDGVRWDLATYSVLDKHAHSMCQPRQVEPGSSEYFSLTSILHSVKSYTAKRINQLTGESGPVWKRETFDRQVRNAADFVRLADYIANNAVNAGYCDEPHDWPWFYVSQELVTIEPFDMWELKRMPL